MEEGVGTDTKEVVVEVVADGEVNKAKEVGELSQGRVQIYPRHLQR